MKLVDLCEPLFQYICRLNRSARKGGDHRPEEVRAELRAILADIQAKARTDPALANQLDKDRGGMYLALPFFSDFMVRNSSLPFATHWEDLAAEERPPELGGDEKFFDMLDKALADRSEGATERIAVYYTCMGLGFTGWYTGQPEHLRRKMMECSLRLRGQINADESTPVCPDSYNADTRELFRPIGSSLVGITITLIVLLIAVFAGNVYVYHTTASELSGKLDQLGASKLANAPAAAAAPAPARASR
jgi:type VI secretion system protein ImpK